MGKTRIPRSSFPPPRSKEIPLYGHEGYRCSSAGHWHPHPCQSAAAAPAQPHQPGPGALAEVPALRQGSAPAPLVAWLVSFRKL